LLFAGCIALLMSSIARLNLAAVGSAADAVFAVEGASVETFLEALGAASPVTRASGKAACDGPNMFWMIILIPQYQIAGRISPAGWLTNHLTYPAGISLF
jgi:hypothetical protein